MNIDLFLRASTFLLFIVIKSYWWVNEKRANRDKKKTRHIHMFELQNFERIVNSLSQFIVLLQLIGLSILPMVQSSQSIQVFGFLFACVGFWILISARKELSTNWANAWEHQVKKNQQLVTTGIYRYIRHPIYIGLLSLISGAELVAKSNLYIIFIFGLAWAYIQGKREEKILLAYFGGQYANYMKRTKMFIPYIL